MGKKQESPKQKVNQPAYRVSICHDRKKGKFFLLEEALEKADFWEIIQEAWKSSKLAQKKFLILIKPDLNMFDINSTTGTDPELVEHLIDLLCQKGFANIMVADSPGDADLWLENRDVLILADLLGYKFETPGQQLWLEYLKPYIDEYEVDVYGTTVGIINPGKEYKVVIEGFERHVILDQTLNESKSEIVFSEMLVIFDASFII